MIDGKRIRLSVPAKINWSLEVVGKRADGYHQLRSLMHGSSLSFYLRYLLDMNTLGERIGSLF